MQKKCLIFLIFLITILVSCGSRSYDRIDNGISIDLDVNRGTAPEKVKLQVVNNNIIRVIEEPEETYSEKSNLAILDKERKVDYKVKEEGSELLIETDSITVRIDRNKGKISFQDGKRIKLETLASGGSYFQPVELYNGDSSYSIKQKFNSEESEALYGLGQHQNGEMNYKGKNVDLFQHNIIASVPFLVSSQNYGILWNNSSHTKFGNPKDYKDISDLTLYSSKGEKGGLTATYKNYNNPNKIYLSKQASKIDYEYLNDLDKIPDEFPMEEGIVEWSGHIESDTAGEHKFYLHCSGYTKMWIDGEKIIDHWRQSWLPWRNKIKLDFEEGEKHSIKIKWRPDAGEAFIALKYLEPRPRQEQELITLSSEAGEKIDYFFINGNNLDEVISGYREVTGKAPIMPKWSLGYWQSRERYATQNELMNVVKEYRDRNIPLDNIVLDWRYWEDDKWGSHEFDSTRFPDPQGMVDSLNNIYNTNIMISVWPKFYKGTQHFKEMQEKGYLYPRLIEQGVKDWIGYNYTFYDVYDKNARKLFWSQIKDELYSKGFNAWWMDATEPTMVGNSSLEERKLQMHPTSFGPSTKYFNAYSLYNTKGVYKGLKEEKPNKRPFILTRSAFTGQQRYSAATWSGDVAATWLDLGRQISAGLNFSLSGIPYWTTDIGGFSVPPKFKQGEGEDQEEWRALMTRWFQFGTFSPLFRSHGQEPVREIFNVSPKGHTAYETMVYYDKLRYRLMPYIYSIAGKTYHEDYTIMRALIMDFPSDTNVYNIGDQYMFGPNLMVAPVTEYQKESKEVYLPSSSDWYNLYTGDKLKGGQNIETEAPLSKIPVFVKEGSILPFGPEIEYTSQKEANPLLVYVFTGQDGSFKLYADGETNTKYKNREYSWIPFEYDHETEELTIKKRRGDFEGMQKKRTLKIVWVDKENLQKLDFNVKPDRMVQYTGRKLTIKKK